MRAIIIKGYVSYSEWLRLLINNPCSHDSISIKDFTYITNERGRVLFELLESESDGNTIGLGCFEQSLIKREGKGREELDRVEEESLTLRE